jgi:hypothetical protein
MAPAAKDVAEPLDDAQTFRAAQAVEWGTYIAVAPISIDGVRAFNPGDPVPVGHVTRGLVDETQVARTPSAEES